MTGALAVALTWASSLQAAKDPNAKSQRPSDVSDWVSPAAVPIEHRRVHYTGDIWMALSNNGSWGTDAGSVTCDERDLQALRITYCPGFEFPGGTRIDYMFNGSLWIGGIVGADTLLSAAKTSGSGDALEWNGFAEIEEGVRSGYPGECDTITRHLQQSYTAEFYDTLIRPGSNHTPLGLKIVQTTTQSADNFTRRFIICDYKITNISDRPIDRMWFGLFFDNDVYWASVSGCTEDRFSDDIEGILPTWPNPVNPIYSDSLMVAWATDNDGDACGSPRFPRYSARGAMGLRVLRGPSPDSRINYNWFVTNFANIDWGPRMASDVYNFGTGGTGLPPGDEGTYHVMANDEVDYSQPYAALDFSEQGWQKPLFGATGANIANGLDSRMLVSSGPLDELLPGQTVPFTVAFIAGGDLHRDPLNSIDPQNPQPFMDKLDFSDLATNAWWAGYVWDNFGFDTDGDGYRGEFYRPVVGDTIFYTGDGCPDLAGPAPPKTPDAANSDLRLESRPGELILRWSGRTIETDVDPLVRKVDFEGYRVYVAERNSSKDQPSAEDYSLIASWDKVDYRRYTFDEQLGYWVLDSDPLTNEGWRAEFNDPAFDAEEHLAPSFASCYRYMGEVDGVPMERCAYFVPQDANHANTYEVAGQVEQNLIQLVRVRDTVVDDVPYQYGEYELRLRNLLQSRFYFLTLTVFDFGDPFNSLEPLETPPGGIRNRVVGVPVYSSDVVEAYSDSGGVRADSVRVSVYPNPYKIAIQDASGRKTSYFEQGFEGDIGQDRLNEEDRRIHFINLPDTCEINIYTLDGDLVRTLTHPDDNLSGYTSEISWDMISRNTQAVTSGIYLYRVDSRLGSQVGKLVIIK